MQSLALQAGPLPQPAQPWAQIYRAVTNGLELRSVQTESYMQRRVVQTTF
jgi:hypothetical protein